MSMATNIFTAPIHMLLLKNSPHFILIINQRASSLLGSKGLDNRRNTIYRFCKVSLFQLFQIV